MDEKSSGGYSKFDDDVNDESLENAREGAIGVTRKEPLLKKGVRVGLSKANASKRTGRLRSISLGEWFSETKRGSGNAKVKKENTKGNLKNGDSQAAVIVVANIARKT